MVGREGDAHRAAQLWPGSVEGVRPVPESPLELPPARAGCPPRGAGRCPGSRVGCAPRTDPSRTPFATLPFATLDDILSAAVFLGMATVTINLAAATRRQIIGAQQRERLSHARYAMSESIAGMIGTDRVVRVLGREISLLLDAPATLWLADGPGPGPEEGSAGDAPTAQAARWAMQHGVTTGAGVGRFGHLHHLVVPMLTPHSRVGALIAPARADRTLAEALADQAAMAIERARLAESMTTMHRVAETERLRSALLSSISHDLRTPLASIIGSVTTLQAPGSELRETARGELLETIREEALRLDRFVGNLLDMTKLESGVLTLRRDWVGVGEIIGAATHRLGAAAVEVQVAPDLPDLPLDFVLTEHALFNLLDNARKYGPPGGRIRITAGRAGAELLIAVEDDGPGIPEPAREVVFDRFHRLRDNDRGAAGTGLGLSICRGFVEAQQGTVTATAAASGGARFEVRLPIPPSVLESMEGSVERYGKESVNAAAQ